MSGTALKETRNPWIFGSLALAYATGLLLVLPWATLPGYSAPFLTGVYGTTIFAADCCTVIMLMRLYLREGAPHLLVFGAAYVLSALLVVGHALSFPHAFGLPRLLGHETTSVILYLCWRVGAAALLLVGMVFGVRSRAVVEPVHRARHVAFTLAASALTAMLVYGAALRWHMATLQGDRFSPATLAWSWVAV